MEVVITGASKGIGYEIVRQFAALNKEISISALSRSDDLMKNLKKDCEQINPSIRLNTLKYDLSNARETNQAIEEIWSSCDKLDILINNAGQLLNTRIEKISENDMYALFEVNFFSVIRLIKGLLPLLKSSSKAHIVNIGSMGGYQGSAKFPGLSLYSASKAALSCLTECLAEEFKHYSISVNCLALGAVNTGMLSEAFPGYTSPVSPKSMATFIIDFAMSAPSVINGKTIPVSSIDV